MDSMGYCKASEFLCTSWCRAWFPSALGWAFACRTCSGSNFYQKGQHNGRHIVGHHCDHDRSFCPCSSNAHRPVGSTVQAKASRIRSGGDHHEEPGPWAPQWLIHWPQHLGARTGQSGQEVGCRISAINSITRYKCRYKWSCGEMAESKWVTWVK